MEQSNSELEDAVGVLTEELQADKSRIQQLLTESQTASRTQVFQKSPTSPLK